MIGAAGGRKGTTGGFYANRELARIAGAKGGRVSRRANEIPTKQFLFIWSNAGSVDEVAELINKSRKYVLERASGLRRRDLFLKELN